ncbi:hypothetical protein Xant_19095 [Xanthomonas cissicola]|uniref:Uncharacterized protein n=1 Tax=Xanthomonas cissicola TaxID=86186 RepID=A0ABX3M295_9XANT|nr:hypothetical protein Xant_19095 [Xanthomonas cissicola]
MKGAYRSFEHCPTLVSSKVLFQLGSVRNKSTVAAFGRAVQIVSDEFLVIIGDHESCVLDWQHTGYRR